MTVNQHSRFDRLSFILKQVQTQTALESRFRLGLENLKKRLKNKMRSGFSICCDSDTKPWVQVENPYKTERELATIERLSIRFETLFIHMIILTFYR